MLLRLGHDDSEDAVLHARMNIILINTNGESERPREFPDASLRDPILGFRHLSFLRSRLHDLSRALLCAFIFDCCLVVVGLAAFGDCVGWLGRFNGPSRRRVGGVGALGSALDCDGLDVGEFDGDVLLIDSGKVAVKLVCMSEFLDVELGLEGLHDAAAVMVFVVGVLISVEVIEEAE